MHYRLSAVSATLAPGNMIPRKCTEQSEAVPSAAHWAKPLRPSKKVEVVMLYGNSHSALWLAVAVVDVDDAKCHHTPHLHDERPMLHSGAINTLWVQKYGKDEEVYGKAWKLWRRHPQRVSVKLRKRRSGGTNIGTTKLLSIHNYSCTFPAVWCVICRYLYFLKSFAVKVVLVAAAVRRRSCRRANLQIVNVNPPLRHTASSWAKLQARAKQKLS